MTHWLYMPHLETAGKEAILEGAEAAHAVRARRLRIYDSVYVFDGAGRIAVARINDVTQRPLQVHLVIDQHKHRPSSAARIHLFSALPKGDRQATMLDMATQLGMTDYTPLRCERSVSQPRPSAYDRWHRLLIESCKQSHRPWIPVLHPPVDLKDWVSQCADRNAVNVIADKRGATAGQAIENRLLNAEYVCLVVGPEGGFSDTERAHLGRAQSEMLSLGDGMLRVETAAVALTAFAGRLLVSNGPDP
ncbi:MAG TPA: hypothetical protein DHW07_07230 [Gammaproteobacteria bacterium]|nr:hypothetical protein [Gammaproteobacteria bacterium]